MHCPSPTQAGPGIAYLPGAGDLLSSRALALWSQKKKGTDGLKNWASNCYMCSHPCCDWWMVDKAKPMGRHLCCDKNMCCNTSATGHTRARQLVPVTEPDRSHRNGLKEIESLRRLGKYHVQIFSCASYGPCKNQI